MQVFLSVFSLDRDDQQRRWTFHLMARNILRYIFRINGKSTTLSRGQGESMKFKLRTPESTATAQRRPLHFVFEQIGKVGLWSTRLLTITVYSPSNIWAQLSVSGIIFEVLEEQLFEVVPRGKPRMFFSVGFL